MVKFYKERLESWKQLNYSHFEDINRSEQWLREAAQKLLKTKRLDGKQTHKALHNTEIYIQERRRSLLQEIDRKNLRNGRIQNKH